MPMSKDEMREYQRKRREKLRAGVPDVSPAAARIAALLSEIEALRAENAVLRAGVAQPVEDHPETSLVQRYVENALEGALSKSTVALVSWKDRNKR